VIVRFHPRARQRVKVVTTWWEKTAVVDDMTFLRVLLRKTKQNVFYTFDEAQGVSVIQSVWGAKLSTGALSFIGAASPARSFYPSINAGRSSCGACPIRPCSISSFG